MDSYFSVESINNKLLHYITLRKLNIKPFNILYLK